MPSPPVTMVTGRKNNFGVVGRKGLGSGPECFCPRYLGRTWGCFQQVPFPEPPPGSRGREATTAATTAPAACAGIGFAALVYVNL